TIEGTIVLEASGKLTIQTATGIRKIRIRDILSREKGESALDIYREKAGALGPRDAIGHYELGLWCKEQGLAAEAKAEFQETIRFDRDHDGARRELGYVLRGGRWVLGQPKPKKKRPSGDAPPKGGDVAKEPSKPDPAKKKSEKTVDPSSPSTGGLTPEQQENQKIARANWRKRIAEYDGVPWERAHRIKGPGFLLVCNSSREVAEWYWKALVKIDYELRRFFTNKGTRIRRFGASTTSVYVYRTQKEFMEKEGRGPNTGGFFRINTGSIHAYHGPFGATGNTIAVLGHEYTHKWESMIVDNWKNMPPWIYEGLAVYFGDGIIVPAGKGKAKTHQIPRDRLRVVQRAIVDKRYIKVADLIRTPPGRFSGFHYAHAWSVIYFMVNSSKSNQTVFNKLFTNMILDKYSPSDFEEVCKGIGGVAGFEQRWKEWVMLQQAPPPGDVVEDTYESYFSNFRISRPSADWEFVVKDDVVPVDERMYFQIALAKKNAHITILSSNNAERLSADAVVARKVEQLKKTHEVISSDRLIANGYEAYDIIYKDKPPEPKKEPAKPKVPSLSETPGVPSLSPSQEGDGGKEGEGKEGGEEGKKAEVKPPELMKYRRVYLTTVPHVIILQLSAPVKEFDALLPQFEKTVQSFLLTLR
ncbi:MAG: hypothetical protein O6952_09335, partial [Planctomycetota bacterium]|nr:hypothetical protein [Planctomycetota bacterium]